MATEFVDEIDEDTSPKDLRAKLSEAYKQIRSLSDENVTFKAKDFLAEKGFDLVEAADLKGVAPAELEAKATEVQEARVALQEKLLRAALSKHAEGEDLEELVANAVGRRAEDDGTAEAARRIRQVGGAEGKPIPAVDPSKLHGMDALLAHFESEGKRK